MTGTQLPVLVVEVASADFEQDMRQKGWVLVEDTGARIGEATLSLDDFLHDGESRVRGHEMVERAKAMNCLAGQRYAECLLAQGDRLLWPWKAKGVAVPGTIWRDQYGNLQVPILVWRGPSSDYKQTPFPGASWDKDWVMRFVPLDKTFSGGLLCLRPEA